MKALQQVAQRYLSPLPLLLTFFLLVAFAIRVWNLGIVPVGFHADEANIGYNAYSLLKTGHDKNGVFLPLAIDEFGDFRPAGYHYIDILSVAIFGLNEFATRFPSALFGALLVIPIFLFVNKLFKSKTLALIVSGLWTVSPWSIIVSRATSESILAMFAIILGFYFFYTSISSKKRTTYAILSVFFLVLSLFFYHAARFFVPVFLPLLSVLIALISKDKSTKKFLILFTIITIILAAVVLLISNGAKRPLAVSIFNSPESKLVLEEQIREDGGQAAMLTRIYHNKLLAYAGTFFTNYLQYFSGDYLFLKGGLPPRYIVPNTGMMYPIELPFLIIGFSFLLFQAFKQKEYIYLVPLAWLLIAPIPAALTFEDIPDIQRSIMMLPALIMLVGFGIWIVFSSLKNKRIKYSFIIVITAIFIFNIAGMLHEYFHHTFTHRPWYRSVGEKELIATEMSYYNSYDQIEATSQGDNNIIFYLFYLKIDPSYYQKLGSPRDRDNLQFGKFLFTYNGCPFAYKLPPEKQKEIGKKNILYVASGDCKVPVGAVVLNTIKRTDGTPAYRILKVDPKYQALLFDSSVQ